MKSLKQKVMGLYLCVCVRALCVCTLCLELETTSEARIEMCALYCALIDQLDFSYIWNETDSDLAPFVI